MSKQGAVARAAQRARGGTCVLMVVIGLLITGCKVGPNYAPPAIGLKPEFSMAEQPRFRGELADVRAWWRYLEDPYLDQLVAHLLDQNLTLRQAGLRVLEAQARLIVARGGLFPQTQTMTGNYAQSKISSTNANFFSQPGIFVPNLWPQNVSTAFNFNWELDFWGRFRRLIESSDANLGAAVAAQDEVMVLLLAEMTSTYVEMRTCEYRLRLVTRNLELQRKTLELAERKRKSGVATATDVGQAQANVGQAGAQLPVLETQRRQACHRLCVLLGREPVDLYVELGATGRIPQPPMELAVGIPVDLVRRRPDVRRAERELASQCARIGFALTDFYPHFFLTGALGVSSHSFNKLFEEASLIGLIAPSFSWNILNYFRIKANVEAEKAAFARLEAAYRQTILVALREAEDAQVAYALSYDRAKWFDIAVAGSQAAVDEADKTFERGTTESGRVYILQSELLRQQDQLAIANATIAQNLIALFRALGGGWELRLPCAPQLAPPTSPPPGPVVLLAPEFSEQPATVLR